ncbi:MAG: YDG domain-containing protein, partial [Acidobacteriota bacterium]|nr:YDG domain-containing protein [Acidobacteriota bacterium]
LAKAITGVFTAANKTYDGSIAATVTGTLQGVVAEDNVALGGTGTFSDSGVGRGKTVAITGGLLGADAGNYTVAFNTTAQADILADPVSDGYDAALGSAQKLSSSNSSQSVGYVSRQNRLVEAGGADRSDAATLVGCDESGCASYVVIDGGINIPTSNR